MGEYSIIRYNLQELVFLRFVAFWKMRDIIRQESQTGGKRRGGK